MSIDSVSAEQITDFDWMKDKITFKLINAENNQEKLMKQPHIRFHDLAIVFYAVVVEQDGKLLTAAVTNELMNKWGIDINRLISLAKENTERIFPARVFNVGDLLDTFFGDSAPAGNVLEDDGTEIQVDSLYACTNDLKMNGAGTILYDGVLKRFAEKAGCDIYILPSSVHEVLLVPDAMKISVDDLKEMVKDVNRTVVSAEDFLSDNVYVYRRIFGFIEAV